MAGDHLHEGFYSAFGILKVHNTEFVQVSVKMDSQRFYLKDHIKFTKSAVEKIIILTATTIFEN